MRISIQAGTFNAVAADGELSVLESAEDAAWLSRVVFAKWDEDSMLRVGLGRN
jgi:hypothetical protein